MSLRTNKPVEYIDSAIEANTNLYVSIKSHYSIITCNTHFHVQSVESILEPSCLKAAVNMEDMATWLTSLHILPELNTAFSLSLHTVPKI